MAKKRSQKDLRKENIEEFSRAVLEASQTYGKSPALITKAEYNEFASISDWELRKLGGFSNLLKVIFPFDEQDLASIRENQKLKNYVSKLERELGDKQLLEKEIKQAIIGKIKSVKVFSYKRSKSKVKINRDVVGMLNDTHIGLIVNPEEVNNLNEFNFQIASRRIAYFTDELCNYKLDKRDEVGTLHLILNGDLIAGIIHGLQGRDLEMLTHQVNGAVHIFTNAITRLVESYPNVKVYFSTGNHGDSPHRREGGRVISQVYDSIEGQIFYAISAAHKDTKNVEFITGKTLYQDFQLPAGRAIFTHGHIMFSKEMGNPGTSLNTKALSGAISDFNSSEIRQGRHPARLVLAGHSHCHAHVTTRDGTQFYNAPSLSGIDSFAYSIGINHNLTAQVMFESTKDYIIGDSRLLHVQKADNDPKYDQIIKPYEKELVFKK